MNCQQLALILDERDLDRLPADERVIAEAHLANCPACAREQDLHRRLNGLPIPSLSAERIAGWRAVALSSAGARQQMRSRLVIVSTLVAVAAAAALLAVSLMDAPDRSVAEERSTPHVSVTAGQRGESPAVAADLQPVTTPAENETDAMSASLPADSFTVLVLPLQIDGANPAARTLGEDFQARFLERLRGIPGLVLLQESKRAGNTKPADFRLKVTSGYGKVPERFGGHEQWTHSLMVEALIQNHGYMEVLGLSNNPDCGRISPVDLANFSNCSPAGMVEIDIQQLRHAVFPPDPAVARQLQTRFLDTSLPQGVRRQALAELIELRQRTASAMDPELIRVIIEDAIANASNPAQRANLWRALRGQSSAAMIQPLISNLRREPDDSVRLEMVSILVAEFSADPSVRAELDLVAKRDAKLLVRKVAERALTGDSAWRSYVVTSVRDSTLPAASRFEALDWMGDPGIVRSDPQRDAELVAIARQLFDDGDAVALAEVLTSAGNGSRRAAAGLLQIRMSSLQHPAVADFLIALVDRQADFSVFSLLGRHRDDPRIEAKLKDIAANHRDAGVRQLAAAQLINQ